MSKTQSKALSTIEELLAEQFAAVTSELTATPEPEAPVVTEGRKVRTANIVAFGDAIGLDLTEWTLVDVLDSLREYGTFGEIVLKVTKNDRATKAVVKVSGMPEGWTFGEKARTYLAFGEWEV